jgi:hypothetical protein
MKVISIWQPWATLIVHGFKFFETRTWAPPRSVLGKEIGIAATKSLLPAQIAAYNDPEFQFFYKDLGLPPLDELPRGYLLGTATLDSYEVVTPDFLDDITREERAYGWFKEGGFAWRMLKPKLLEHPIPIKGAQGLYEWKGFENGTQAEGSFNNRPQGAANLRSYISLC